EPGRGAGVVDQVVGDGVIGGDAFHAGGVLLVRAPVVQVHVLRVAHCDPAARDVDDGIAHDARVDDVVDERDPFVAAVLHHVPQELDRVGVVDGDRPGQRV